MGGSDDDKLIPSVFIGYSSGQEILEKYTYEISKYLCEKGCTYHNGPEKFKENSSFDLTIFFFSLDYLKVFSLTVFLPPKI